MIVRLPAPGACPWLPGASALAAAAAAWLPRLPPPPPHRALAGSHLITAA